MLTVYRPLRVPPLVLCSWQAIEMLRHRTFLPTGGLTKPRKDFDWDGSNIK